MFKKILLAFDGSKHSGPAFDRAAGVARLCDTELHMIGIVASRTGLAMTEPSAQFDIWNVERDRVERSLAEATQEAAARGVKVFANLREGDPAKEIAKEATAMNADLVVIGHSDKGKFARWLQGSVGADLVRDLPGNLLIATS